MIFDNVDSPEILKRYWPACAHGSILITTQDRKLVHRAQSHLCLEPFDEDEGSSLLLQYLPDKHEGVATKETLGLAKSISREVQGLPLDLVGLAGFIVDSRATLPDTLRDLKNHVDLVCDSTTFQYGPAHLAFDVSLNSLPPAAMSVLQVLSMLSPDSIPEDFFVKWLGEAPLRLQDCKTKTE